MKMYYGNTPVNSMRIKHYEMNTNDCTAIPSDLQAGVTCVSKGKKITGTGKSFEFAYYGARETNSSQYIPNNINVIEMASVDYPIQLAIPFSDMKNSDFTVLKTIGNIIIDSIAYPIKVQAVNNVLTISCDMTVTLQLFYGKDNYI